MFAKNSIKFFPSILSFCTLAFLTGCSEEAPQQHGPAEVNVYTLNTEPVTLTTELPGRTVAYAVAEVRPQIGGIVLKRNFIEGADVKAGQALYQIDSATYRASSDSAKASLASAEASLATAKSKAARYKDLVTAQAISKQDYDDAVATMKQGLANVLLAKANLETARINLGYTEVKAPISGRIGRSSVTQGALVSAAQTTALATIQQLDPIYVDVNQSSKEYLRLRQEFESGRLQRIKNGIANVKLIMEDGSVYAHEGVLQFSDINIDPSTSAVTMRAVFPNPKRLLLPGVFVRATIEEGVSESTMLLPQKAVLRDQKGEPYTFVVDGGNKVHMRYVVLGQAIGDKWVTLKGINAGERVIVEGVQKVQPDQIVKPMIVNQAQAVVEVKALPNASKAAAVVIASSPAAEKVKDSPSTKASQIQAKQ